jgi:transposase-like protein
MRKRREFTNEFKLEAVKLAERGEVPVAQVARDLDLHQALRAYRDCFSTHRLRQRTANRMEARGG